MVYRLPIIFGAGVIHALLVQFSLLPSLGPQLLSLFAPLPLMVATLLPVSLHHVNQDRGKLGNWHALRPGLYALALGSILILLAPTPWPLALEQIGTLSLPGFCIARVARDRRLDKIMIAIFLYACFLGICLHLLLTLFHESYALELEKQLDILYQHNDLSQAYRPFLKNIFYWQPIARAVFLVLTLTLNLWLAGICAQISGFLVRDWPPIPQTFKMPRIFGKWFAFLTSGGLLALIFPMDSFIFLLWACLWGPMAMVCVLQGIARMHALTFRMDKASRFLFLTFVYLAFLVILPVAVIFFLCMGLAYILRLPQKAVLV